MEILGLGLFIAATPINILALKKIHREYKLKKQGYRPMKKHKYIKGMFVEEREDDDTYEFSTIEEIKQRRKVVIKKLNKLKI